MKIFAYNYRDNDESEFFDKYSKEMGIELGICRDYPTLENAELAKGYEGLSVIVSDMNGKLLEKFYEIGVRYITSRSIGYDHFDLKKAKELGIKIGNVSYSPNSVANYTIMMMLMACRKMKYIMDSSKVQDFSLTNKRGRELSNSTVGVIGTGRIGRTVIEHLSGFGCKILAYDIYRSEEVEKYAEYMDLNELLKKSDIVTFHTPATKENYHLINKESLAIMKSGVIVVNTARGPLIDTDVLINGLESGKIGAAALDVIEKEFGLYYYNLSGQVINNSELAILKSFPNVIVTPHTAFYTDQAVSDMVKNSLKGCCLFAEGKKSPWEIV